MGLLKAVSQSAECSISFIIRIINDTDPGNFCGPGGKLELTELHVKWIVAHIHHTLAHVDGLGQQSHISLVVNLTIININNNTFQLQ